MVGWGRGAGEEVESSYFPKHCQVVATLFVLVVAFCSFSVSWSESVSHVI